MQNIKETFSLFMQNDTSKVASILWEYCYITGAQSQRKVAEQKPPKHTGRSTKRLGWELRKLIKTNFKANKTL